MKATENKRTELITFLLTPKELEILTEATNKAGLFRSELIRTFLFRGIKEMGILTIKEL